MKSIRKQLLDAMTTVVENNGGELHGSLEFLLYKIYDEANPVHNNEMNAAFNEVVEKMGLKFLVAGSRDIEYIIDLAGEINLVHRGYMEL